MDEEPLPLATYATILAHIVSHREEPLEKVLGALGVTAEQLQKADAHFNERLRESLRLRKGLLALTFASAFAEARKAQGLFTAVPASRASPHAGPESTALPSYMTASPAPSSPAWQAPVAAPAPAPAPAPVSVAAPPPVAPPPVAPAHVVPTTAEIPVMKPPPSAMPFRAAPPGAPAAAAPHPAASGAVTAASANAAPAPASSGVGTGTQLAPSDAPRLPDTPWDQVASRVGKLTLAHYAALTVELSRNPTDLAPLLHRYGLSNADDLRHVDAAFQAQMQFDPSLRAQFDALIGRMRSMSVKRD